MFLGPFDPPFYELGNVVKILIFIHVDTLKTDIVILDNPGSCSGQSINQCIPISIDTADKIKLSVTWSSENMKVIKVCFLLFLI